MTEAARCGAVVLAAGAGRRFGGGKLLADLEGRPVLQHVLNALRPLRLAQTVVVLGDDAPAIEAAMVWAGEQRARNPDPARGLASSLRVGLGALQPDLDAALIVLGDQPGLRGDVAAKLLAVDLESDLVAVVPRYTGGAGRNPVLLPRCAWDVAHRLAGDHGLGAWLAEHGPNVHEVLVDGENPDVDTQADLALIRRAMRVRAVRKRADRFREAAKGADS